MHIHFSVPDTFPRWAWTEGLHSQGQQEITVPLTWLFDDSRDQQIMRLLHTGMVLLKSIEKR